MNKPRLRCVSLLSKPTTWVGITSKVFRIYRGKFLGKDVGTKIEIHGGSWRTIDFDENQYAEIELINLLENRD